MSACLFTSMSDISIIYVMYTFVYLCTCVCMRIWNIRTLVYMFLGLYICSSVCLSTVFSSRYPCAHQLYIFMYYIISMSMSTGTSKYVHLNLISMSMSTGTSKYVHLNLISNIYVHWYL